MSSAAIGRRAWAVGPQCAATVKQLRIAEHAGPGGTLCDRIFEITKSPVLSRWCLWGARAELGLRTP
jgi:hypothetical protein